jgi:hypothetical protein
MFFGTDPEFFIVERKSGRPVPAHRFFPDKTKKVEVPQGNEYSYYRFKPGAGGKLFRDGYALEINTAPSTCRGLLIATVANTLLRAQEIIRGDYKLVSTPTVQIDIRADLMEAPGDVLTMGCDPSWNAYTGVEAGVPVDALSYPYRTLAGHLHFAQADVYKNQPVLDESLYPLITKMFDLFIGVPLTYLTSTPATFQRRELYGRAGEFRIQEYPLTHCAGIEYRVPDATVYNSDLLVQMALGVGRRILEPEVFGKLATSWDPKIEPKVRDAINLGKDVEALLPTVPGYYNPELLKEVREVYGDRFQEFHLIPTEEEEAAVRVNNSGWYYQVHGWSYTVGGALVPKNFLSKHSWEPETYLQQPLALPA